MKVVFVAAPTLVDTFRVVSATLRSRGTQVVCSDNPVEPRQAHALVRDADVLVVGSNFRCDRATLEAARKLRAVIYGATGTDGIDVAAACSLGIVIGHAPTPENCVSMAEATVLLILALLYDLRGAEESMRQNVRRPPALLRGRMLAGKTVGLVGYGRIAARVAERLAGWAVEVKIFSRSVNAENMPAHVQRVGLEELLGTSDVISLHATHVRGSPPLIGARELALMKPTAVLVNTARGSLVDEAALVRALSERRIAGAALDTFEKEPLPLDSPLRALDNVVLTPHAIGHTRDSLDSLERVLLVNIENALKGLPPLYVKNPEVLSRWIKRYGSTDEGVPTVH